MLRIATQAGHAFAMLCIFRGGNGLDRWRRKRAPSMPISGREALSLADDGEHGDGIIGATVYSSSPPVKPGAPLAAVEHAEFHPL